MGDFLFGEKVDGEAFILNAIRKLPKLNSVDARVVLCDLYVQEYKIYDHRAQRKKRPMSSVAFHPAESINADSILEDSLRAYLSRGVKDKFGLNILEFMELPSDVIDVLLKVGDESLAKQNEDLANLERQFKT